MRLYHKCRNFCSKVRKQGFQDSVKYYLNRKKEQERVLRIIQAYHLTPEQELERQRNTEPEYSPLISIITPLYNTPEEFLRQLLESVQSQTYGNWELCLADGSDKEHTAVEEICTGYARSDSRIIYKKLEKNEGIVGNTNRCIELASGAYCGLLDHDDLLHPSALFKVVEAIGKGADFIYTDEMKFRDSIERSTDIVCKNGFGKDELRSHNYICHFVVFQRSLLEGEDVLYRKECEGSQDYDMTLRLTEQAEHIVHIPQILYYWRMHEGSVSMNLSGKQYAVDAAKRAIAAQLKREREPGTVECNDPYETIYRLAYRLEEHPVVSVILWGNLRGRELEDYIRGLLAKTSYRPLEIVLPCENSGVKKEFYVQEPFVHTSLKPGGDYLLYLNEACMPVNTSWVEELLMYAQREDIGVVGPHMTDRNGRTYFAGAVLDYESPSGIHVINHGLDAEEQGYEANMKHVRNTTVLTMLCMMVSKNVFEELDGFDEELGACKDADFCIRSIRHGKKNVWTCFCSVTYSGAENLWTECAELKKRWEQELEKGDEYYHPLLKKLKWM